MATRNLSDLSGMDLPSAKGFRFGIVVAEWNREITGALYRGAFDLLTEQGVPLKDIIVAEVPGSFELTSGADMLLNSVSLDAVICLGCVIQGETRHFDFICSAVAQGITHVSVKHDKPVIFGVLTTDNAQQAIDRSGGKHGNKGVEAAATAIKMAALQRSLNKPQV
jgi:6,7-dimethyl-8-ribityllumazine synthase